jgi:hypothetical protein
MPTTKDTPSSIDGKAAGALAGVERGSPEGEPREMPASAADRGGR